jgi:hypothetical protein
VVNPGVFLDAFQVNYFPSPPGGGLATGIIDITNTGALGADPFGPNSGTTGRICVNFYVFTADEQETECCSCPVTPNGLEHITASDLTSNPGNGIVPTLGLVIKLLATVPGPSASAPGTNGVGGTPANFTNSVCNAAYAFDTDNLAPGMRAWAITTHTLNGINGLVRTEFSPAILSPGEISKMTTGCMFLSGNQSGAGICKSCTLGGLGAAKR